MVPLERNRKQEAEGSLRDLVPATSARNDPVPIASPPWPQFSLCPMRSLG